MKKCGVAKTLAEVFSKGNFSNMEELSQFPCAERTDYEPCADKFEDIYKKHLTKYAVQDVFQYAAQCVAYCVKPICVKEK